MRRLLVIGTGGGTPSHEAAEKLGGTAAARLLTSGETKAVIDVSGLSFDADFAARVGLAAALRSWRYDQYRTKLKDKQKPTLTEVTIVGGGGGAGKRYTDRWEPVVEGVSSPANSSPSRQTSSIRKASSTASARRSKESGIEIEVLDRPAMEKLGMGALLGVARGFIRQPRLLVLKWNGGGNSGHRSLSSAKASPSTPADFDRAGPGHGAMSGKTAAPPSSVPSKALALRKAKANFVGICGLVENMPGGKCPTAR